MGIVLDVIIVLIFLTSCILGYKKGLVNVIFNICAFILALIITMILYKPVSNFIIEHTDFDEKIAQVIVENGSISTEKSSEEKDDVNDYIQEYIKNTATTAANNTVEKVSITIAENIINIIVMIILFVISRLLVILLKVVFNGLAKLPLIKQCNEVGGLIYGCIRGSIIILVLLAIAFFVVSMNNNETIINIINSSYITKIIYTNNIILKFIF